MGMFWSEVARRLSLEGLPCSLPRQRQHRPLCLSGCGDARGSAGGFGWQHLAGREGEPRAAAAGSLAGGGERQQMPPVRRSRCLISHSAARQRPSYSPAVPRGQPALEK